MITTAHPAGSARSRRATTVSRDRRIAYTDRIYARLTLRGRLLIEFTLDCFESLTDILAALRSGVPEAFGLARLTVRNMTRGWTIDRPLMLGNRKMLCDQYIMH